MPTFFFFFFFFNKHKKIYISFRNLLEWKFVRDFSFSRRLKCRFISVWSLWLILHVYYVHLYCSCERCITSFLRFFFSDYFLVLTAFFLNFCLFFENKIFEILLWCYVIFLNSRPSHLCPFSGNIIEFCAPSPWFPKLPPPYSSHHCCAILLCTWKLLLQ